MTTMGIINLIIINAMIWVGLSYFWSFWTHKLFKPWGWLELRKRKMVNAEVDKAERRCKDRVRFYAHFFAMQQVEQNETEGAFVVAGVEEPLILRTLRNQCPNRALWALGMPTSIDAPTAELLELMHHDKQNDGAQINFTLLPEVGEVLVNQTADENHLARILDEFRNLCTIVTEIE